MAPLRVGFVGCGSISGPYAGALSRHPRELEIAGAFDIIPERTRSFVAAHGGHAFPSLEARLERVLHHAHRAFHDLLARRDDGRRLLSLQHGRGDLLGVGQVADARLDDLDAGPVQALLHGVLQLLRDLLGMAAQRQFGALGLARVIGVAARELSHGGLDLHAHEVLVVVHVEGRLRGVLDAPHDHGADLDRVADEVVHLDGLAGQVASLDRDLLTHRERVGPVEALVADRAAVAPEQDQRPRDVRRHDEVADHQHHGQRQAQDRQHDEADMRHIAAETQVQAQGHHGGHVHELRDDHGPAR